MPGYRILSARVGEIQSNADPSEWKHIPGEENVADDISRGIYVGDLNGRWSNGPEFLQKPEELWPQEVAKPVSEEHLELRQNKTVCEVKKIDEAIDPKRFSSWKNLVRVTARIQRLANKIRLRRHTQTGKEGPLVPEELEKAERFWIKESQKSLHRQNHGSLPRTGRSSTKCQSQDVDWRLQSSCY